MLYLNEKNLPHSWNKKHTHKTWHWLELSGTLQNCLLPAALPQYNLEKNGNHVAFVFLAKAHLKKTEGAKSPVPEETTQLQVQQLPPAPWNDLSSSAYAPTLLIFDFLVNLT